VEHAKTDAASVANRSRRYAGTPVRVLVTNDDGVDSPGLAALTEALSEHHQVVVVAPATNQSAMARSISLRRDLLVRDHPLPGASGSYAVEGTPVDCVRLAALGIGGGRFDLLMAGINIGYNLGDDVTYSGTVAAAFEAVLIGWPGIAVSQGVSADDDSTGDTSRLDFTAAARFASRLAGCALDAGFPANTLLNVNVPPVARGARVAVLGRRIYHNRLELVSEDGSQRRYRIYGGHPHGHHDEAGTDFAAVGDGMIAVTPLHYDLGVADAHSLLAGLDLERWSC
jgi:5'-nucleotidase